MSSTTGSSMRRSGGDSPTTTPSASAAAAASPNPWAMRSSETPTFTSRLPSRTIATPAAATSVGVGKRTGLMTSSARLP